jgi:hypothetical protein
VDDESAVILRGDDGDDILLAQEEGQQGIAAADQGAEGKKTVGRIEDSNGGRRQQGTRGGTELTATISLGSKTSWARATATG